MLGSRPSHVVRLLQWWASSRRMVFTAPQWTFGFPFKEPSRPRLWRDSRHKVGFKHSGNAIGVVKPPVSWTFRRLGDATFVSLRWAGFAFGLTIDANVPEQNGNLTKKARGFHESRCSRRVPPAPLGSGFIFLVLIRVVLPSRPRRADELLAGGSPLVNCYFVELGYRYQAMSLVLAHVEQRQRGRGVDCCVFCPFGVDDSRR